MPNAVQHNESILLTRQTLANLVQYEARTHVFGGLMAGRTGRTEELLVTRLAILFVVLNHVIVSLKNGIAVDTSEALRVPHLVQSCHQLCHT